MCKTKILKICIICLAATLLGAVAQGSSAVELRIRGAWQVGVGVGTGSLYSHFRYHDSAPRLKSNSNDLFEADSQVKLHLRALVSESLSGVLSFEIGEPQWGTDNQGAALGADSANVITLKHAYIDWQVPRTEISVRMGLQSIILPSSAGGSAIFNTDSAGIAASWKLRESVNLTGSWARPVNDNFNLASGAASNRQHYLDNMDLFALSLPVNLDGFSITPWVMYGFMGKNALRGLQNAGNSQPWDTGDGVLALNIPGLIPGYHFHDGAPFTSSTKTAPWTSMLWAGLPMSISLLSPLKLELDLNYGLVEDMGKYAIVKYGDSRNLARGSTRREGWVAKALLEYVKPWATPGIFAWYASGDDGNIKNGSERLPSIDGSGIFTSFIGNASPAWTSFAYSCDWAMTYAGTWGIGLQVRNITFMEDLTTTARVAYWGGTNSPGMVKYMDHAWSWDQGYGAAGPYLTTNDGLLEFNLVSQWEICDHFTATLDLGYVVNLIDKDTWERRGYYNGEGNGKFEKQDAWKAQLIMGCNY